MIKTIKTVNGSNKHMECSICGTSYSVGFKIIPLPSCACGNVIYFDIDFNQVQGSVNWPFIMVNDEINWKEIVLKEIEEFGKPKNITVNPNERDMFNYENDYNRTFE